MQAVPFHIQISFCLLSGGKGAVIIIQKAVQNIPLLHKKQTPFPNVNFCFLLSLLEVHRESLIVHPQRVGDGFQHCLFHHQDLPFCSVFSLELVPLFHGHMLAQEKEKRKYI